MLNLNELETIWLRYKIKSYIPHVVITFSVIVISSIIILVDFNDETEKTTQKASSVSKIKEIKPIKEINIEEKTIVKKPPVLSNKENKKMVISPSLGFIKSMHKNSPQYYDSLDMNKNLPEERKVYKKEPVEKQEPAIEIEELETEIVKENTINIKRRTTQDDIQQVIVRFKKSNNPALSLFIAKRYYELGNYNQSYNYALITNELNNNIEDSWMIFAKSLVKLNKKSKAIVTLGKYVDYSHSSRAKILLDNIKSGKMK